VADSNGRIDCARHAPQSGSYAGIDPAGLFWSMKLCLSAARSRHDERLLLIAGVT
jgi:hypothetical protein